MVGSLSTSLPRKWLVNLLMSYFGILRLTMTINLSAQVYDDIPERYIPSH